MAHWQFPAESYKNGELSRMLYEEALKAPPLEFLDLKPLTRRQRWAYRLGDYRSRITRAMRILAGRDDD